MSSKIAGDCVKYIVLEREDEKSESVYNSRPNTLVLVRKQTAAITTTTGRYGRPVLRFTPSSAVCNRISASHWDNDR